MRMLVDAELQRTADAAALAGMERLAQHETTLSIVEAVRSEVTAYAAKNGSTLGTNTVTEVASVEIGIWDQPSRTFTVANGASVNAVRTRLERSSARGNGIPTALARAFGFDSLRSSRVAVARLEEPPPYALIGLESFTSRGLLTVDSAPHIGNGSIASNGDVTLNLLGLIGLTWVDGHIATCGQVRRPAIAALTQIRDGTRALDDPLTLPAVSMSAPTKCNDNAKIASLLTPDGSMLIVGAASVPAGTYCVDNMTVLVGAVLNIQGPVTIFVKNDVNIVGTVLVTNTDPGKFKLRVRGPGNVFIAANVVLAADIYAPKSDIKILAGVIYTGRLIGESIDILGTALFFVRPDLPAPELGRSRVALVQ